MELCGRWRDSGREVVLFERPMPDAVSLAGAGVAFEIVATAAGAALEDGRGNRLDEAAGDPLDAAGTLWSRLAASLPRRPGPPGTGAVAMGGFAYDPARRPAEPWSGFPGVLLRVPALTVARVRGRTYATSAGPGFALLDRPDDPPFRARPARTFDTEPVLPRERWMAAVAELAARLRAGEAEKAVLAREIAVLGDGALSAGSILGSLRASYPSCYAYLLSGADGTAFAGATPELLVRRMGLKAVSQPMAGSVGRGDSEEEDDRLAESLATSPKDRAEHRVTRDAVLQRMRSVAESASAPEEPAVVRYANIQHLATVIEARLPAENPPPALAIARALHPTPAICGHPAAAAARLIGELEQMERGWYAGAVGWMDVTGDGEFAVAIRCGLLAGDSARLYAGVGVMPDSDPAAEFAETELKLRALLSAIF